MRCWQARIPLWLVFMSRVHTRTYEMWNGWSSCRVYIRVPVKCVHDARPGAILGKYIQGIVSIFGLCRVCTVNGYLLLLSNRVIFENTTCILRNSTHCNDVKHLKKFLWQYFEIVSKLTIVTAHMPTAGYPVDTLCCFLILLFYVYIYTCIQLHVYMHTSSVQLKRIWIWIHWTS